MWRGTVHLVFATVAALALGACGFADIRSPVPEFMRAKAADPPPPEPPPDVRRMVHEKLDSVFAAGSNPQHVQVSPPQKDPRGPGWLACVRADVSGATGKPMGMQTYRLFIDGGMIVDRRHVEAEDNCETESYEPI
jgi:hypothetical protein